MRQLAIRARCRRFLLLALAAWAAGAPAAYAVQLVGASFAPGLLYDVDAATGAATNPRQIRIAVCGDPCPDPPVNAIYVAGIEVDPAAPATLHALTTISNLDFPSTLLAAPLADPLVPLAGETSLAQPVGEGDLALTNAGDAFYAVGLTNNTIPYTLLRIPVGGDAVVVGSLGTSEVSGLAFAPNGTLYALDTGADVLRAIDPTNAGTLSSVPLSQALGAVAGMDFDPESGLLYVADGGTGGTNTLYTLDPDTGTLTTVGPLGIAGGLSGLAVVPEPGALAAALAACAALGGVARRLR